MTKLPMVVDNISSALNAALKCNVGVPQGSVPSSHSFVAAVLVFFIFVDTDELALLIGRVGQDLCYSGRSKADQDKHLSLRG